MRHKATQPGGLTAAEYKELAAGLRELLAETPLQFVEQRNALNDELTAVQEAQLSECRNALLKAFGTTHKAYGVEEARAADREETPSTSSKAQPPSASSAPSRPAKRMPVQIKPKYVAAKHDTAERAAQEAAVKPEPTRTAAERSRSRVRVEQQPPAKLPATRADRSRSRARMDEPEAALLAAKPKTVMTKAAEAYRRRSS
jgi:hypothetical protein